MRRTQTQRPVGGRTVCRAKSRGALGRSNSRTFMWFLVRFASGWALVLVTLPLLPGVEEWVIKSTVSSLSFFLQALPVKVWASGSMLSVGGVTFKVVADCSSLMPTLVLWVAVLAFPATFGWKLAGVAAGAAVLWVFNILRILSIAFILTQWPAMVEFVHVFLWQTVTLVVVCGLYILWIQLQRPETKGA